MVPLATVALILVFGLSHSSTVSIFSRNDSGFQHAAVAQKQPCKADAFKKQRDACQKKTGYCGIAYTTGKNKNGKTARAYTGCSSSHADKPATYGKGKVLSNDPYRPSWTECFFSNDATCSGGSGGSKATGGGSWFGSGDMVSPSGSVQRKTGPIDVGQF